MTALDPLRTLVADHTNGKFARQCLFTPVGSEPEITSASDNATAQLFPSQSSLSALM